MSYLYRRNKRRRRGASAVEFAIVAPIFFLLLFGMIEFGRMLMVQQLLTNATREGARFAVLEGSTEDEVTDLVVDYLGSTMVTINDDDVSIDPTPETANPGDPISVSVTVPYQEVGWLSPIFLSGTDMEATAVMRKESD